MRVVGKGFRLPGEGVGRIMHKRLRGAVVAKGFEERARHLVELNHRHLLTASNLAHGLWIVAVSLQDEAFLLIEGTTLSRRTEHHEGSLLACTVDESLQSIGEVIVGTRAWAALLLVVVPELAHHTIAFTQGGKNLVEALLGKERVSGETAFSIVGDADLVVEPSRNHLPPRCPRLEVLVDDGGVAAEIEGGSGGVALYLHSAHHRASTAELQRERVVPVQIAALARLDANGVLHNPCSIVRSPYSIFIGIAIFYFPASIFIDDG